MSDMTPQVGGYQLVGRVGTGSTASVWKATDPALGRTVALKQVPMAAVDALRVEAARLAQLDDPHVVQVYGFVEEAGAAYLVEEWIDGATLSEVMAAGGRFSVAQALGVVRGCLLGLAHAHSRGVVHGDVSASNVLVDTGGTSRLIDFGVGGSTPAYRSPEAAAGGTLSPASDVYAAAAVLTHLLGGQMRPDARPDLGRVDAGLRPVLATAMADDPARRYPDAAAFLAALEEAAERTYGAAWWTTAGVPALVAPAVATLVPVGGGAVGAVGAGVATAVGRRTPWRVVVGAGVAALVVAAGAITAVAVTRGGDGDEDAGGSRGGGSGRSDDPSASETADPVVDTVPSGTYTFRSVVTSSDDPTWNKVGTTSTAIWKVKPDCDSADHCGGRIRSTSGTKYSFTWDGTTLVRVVEKTPPIYRAQCIENGTGRPTGPVTVRRKVQPVGTRQPFRSVGGLDAATGLPRRLESRFTLSETIIAYHSTVGGPSGPKNCPWAGNNKVTHTARYRVTITLGADPKVVKAEKRRIAREKRQGATR